MSDAAPVTTAQRTFDATLYDRAALDEALATYADFAEMTLDDGDGDRWTVQVTTAADADYPAERIAAELANFTLLQTIVRRP